MKPPVCRSTDIFVPVGVMTFRRVMLQAKQKQISNEGTAHEIVDFFDSEGRRLASLGPKAQRHLTLRGLSMLSDEERAHVIDVLESHGDPL